MPENPVSAYEARLEIFMARCALKALMARTAIPKADARDPFLHPVETDFADIEGALKTLGAYVAQQDPTREGALIDTALLKM